MFKEIEVFIDKWRDNICELLTSLEEIHDSNEEDSLELKELGVFIEELDKGIITILSKRIDGFKEVNPDHPLFCPVSLYQGIDGGRMEISHTRTLGWLLDPREKHGFNISLIRAFLEHVDKDYADKILKISKVYTEKIIKNNKITTRPRRVDRNSSWGRMDICIECILCDDNNKESEGMVVIEAKIGAFERDEAMKIYDNSLKSKRSVKKNNIRKVFLSQKPPRAAGWIHLNYLKMIESLTKELTKYYNYEPKPEGYHYLRYYLAGVFVDILEWPLPITEAIDKSIALQLYFFMKELEH